MESASKNNSQNWISPLKRIGYNRAVNTVDMADNMNLTPEHQKHLERLWESFCTGIRSKKAVLPKKYLEDRGLDFQKLNIGFCSGQFHHGKDEEWRRPYIEMGVLTPSDAPVNEPWKKAYTCFGAYGIIFPLKNPSGQIINLFGIRIKLASQKEEYLNNLGVYPEYPSPLTRRLYITSTVVEAASIIQSDTLDKREAVIALRDGEWLPQHEQLIQDLERLEQVIILKN